MNEIIDFIIYKLNKTITLIDEDDDDCGRPFHARLNVGRGSDSFICTVCLVDINLVFHPSYAGPIWVERSH